MQTEQFVLPSDHHRRRRSLVHRWSAQLSHRVLFQVFAEHQPVQPVKYITAGQHFTLQLSYRYSHLVIVYHVNLHYDAVDLFSRVCAGLSRLFVLLFV